MAYNPNLPGLDEAARQWIIAQIVANLSSLNAALSRDLLTPVGTLSSSMVLYGDPDALPDVMTAPVLFCVTGGGRLDGLDIDSQQEYLGGIGYRCNLHSSILVYIHPDTLPASDGPTQVASRERLLARICDWLFAACFNTPGAVNPTLTSRQFSTAPDYDQLAMAHLASIEKGYVYRAFAGDQAIFHAHARHTALIAGNL